MSLFYNNHNNDDIAEKIESIEKIEKIPFVLFKRILKDTFDINHVKKSIAQIYTPLLILHSDHYSFQKSCSKILFDSAEKCIKKATFAYEFMNEDFINIFNIFFMKNSEITKEEFSENKILCFHTHPEYKHSKKDLDSCNETKSRNYSDDINNESRRNSGEHEICGSTVLPQEFLISPQIVKNNTDENTV